MNRYILAVVAIAIITSCSNTQPAEKSKVSLLSNATWLTGAWQQPIDSGILVEAWNKVNDTEYAGRSFMVKGKDTITAETVRLVQRDTSLYYIPTVNGQNNGQPVSFRSASITGDRMVFENPAHDFPQRIAYTRVGKDSLFAEISGTINGQNRSEPFPMKRMK